MTDTKDRAAVSPSEAANLRSGIESALLWANHRWSEWGERAEAIENILLQTLAEAAAPASEPCTAQGMLAAPAVPPEPTPVGAREWLAARGQADLSLYWPTNKPLPQIDYESGEAVPTLTQLMEAYAADSRAPAEVLEALKRDVLAEVRTYGLRAGTNIATSLEVVTRRINKLFDAAVKEPTK